MLRRIEPDEAAAATRMPVGTAPSDPIVPVVAEAELETTGLPHDHPSWVRDAIAVSARARELIWRFKPAVVAVMSVWDHRLRSIVIGDRRVRVDPSGCYRADA
ncbi:MAG: hypothetical protein ABI231_02685 [Candidatus Tumulicola sp.]